MAGKKNKQITENSKSSNAKGSGENNICNECGKNYGRISNLEDHVRQEHPGVNAFECTTCRKIYSTKETLWSHIAEIHTNKFNCDSCEQSFQIEFDLNCHDQRDHTTNYDCDQCDHQDTSETSLSIHIKKKHQTEYNCDQCEDQDTSEALLIKHIEIYHTKKLSECKGVGSKKCGIKFQSYNDLMDHRRDVHNSGNKVCQ